MKKHSQKLIFLFAVIIVAVATRTWYAGLSASPSDSQASSVAAPAAADPSRAGNSSSSAAALISTDPAGSGMGASSGGVASSQIPYYGEPDVARSAFERTARTALPSFSNEAFLVADPVNNVDVAIMNGGTRWPTASLTKLMTATLAVDHLSMDTRITITPQMLAVDPSERMLVMNGTYTVNDLLHVMLMPSSNVAAEALADYYGHAKFVAEMNARAGQWGMASTYFDDPSGLSAANESSAHDLALLAAHIYQNYPSVFSFTDTPSIMITELESGARVNVRSINAFAGDPNFIGGKTGYIPQSGDNLLSMFRYNNKPVLIIVLGAADAAQRFGDTTKLLNWFTMNYH